MNLSEIFPREAPESVRLVEGQVWGPVVIEDPRVGAPALGSSLSVADSVASWVGSDDFGHGFTFDGEPKVVDNSLVFTHAEDPIEIIIRPLNDGDWKYFGNGKTEMSMDEIYKSADAMFEGEL